MRVCTCKCFCNSASIFTFHMCCSDKGITPARKVLDNAEKRGALKSQQRKDWIQQRDRYTTSQSTHNILSRLLNICRTKLSDFHLVTKFRDEFWYKSDGMNRPLPTLLWFAKDRSNLNPWLDGLANTGLFLSTIMLATGSANVPLMLGLWLIQRSLMSVGGVWYGVSCYEMMLSSPFNCAACAHQLSSTAVWMGAAVG